MEIQNAINQLSGQDLGADPELLNGLDLPEGDPEMILDQLFPSGPHPAAAADPLTQPDPNGLPQEPLGDPMEMDLEQRIMDDPLDLLMPPGL